MEILHVNRETVEDIELRVFQKKVQSFSDFYMLFLVPLHVDLS